MLSKVIQDCPRGWDNILHFLCFALRVTPNSSTGYSPYELCFRRKVRGLLTLFREELEGTDVAVNNLKMPAAKNMGKLQNDIRIALKAANENSITAQQKTRHILIDDR